MRRKNRLPMLFVSASALALAIACNSSGNSASDEAIVKADAARPAATQAVLDRGAEIYRANCIACHGEGGKGDGPMARMLEPPPRDHSDRAYMDTLTDDDLRKIIVMGGAIKGRPLMPSHAQLRGDDLDALVAYVRSLSTGKG